MVTLFHGSYEDAATLSVHGDGIFGGVFASRRRVVAESHGPNIYAVEIAEDLICDDRDLEASHDADELFATWRARWGAEADRAIADECDMDDETDADASWALQRLRGRIAFELGYRAICMRDEHGVSYLVAPGELLELCE